MARLVLDDSLFTDPRFRALARAVGEDSAIAKCVRAFRIAQRYWADNQQLVPEQLWNLEECDELFEVHLAERRDDGIYVRGSEDYFEWLLKRRQAAQKGGRANRDRLASHKLASANPNASSCLALKASPIVSVIASVSNSPSESMLALSEKQASTPSNESLDPRSTKDSSRMHVAYQNRQNHYQNRI
jgi:hypothetical protein